MAEHIKGVPGSEPIGASNGQPIETNVADHRERGRKRRLPLSCGECRKKKLSCDRKLPCQRCLRSGRSAQCFYETDLNVSTTPDRAHDEKLQQLQAEVTQLKVLLGKVGGYQRATSPPDAPTRTLQAIGTAIPGQIVQQGHIVDQVQELAPPVAVTGSELLDLKARSPRAYYHQHTLFRFFDEIPQLFPVIKQAADEWFKPRGVSLKKSKLEVRPCLQNGDAFEGLLPPKADTDALVSFYLDHLEQIHHVLDIPSFDHEYDLFWATGRRNPTTTALLLAIISISTPISVGSSALAHRDMPPKWISACDVWLGQQNFKDRKLIHYQILCLVYLAKRINSIKKKKFWIETASLIQNAMMDGLHHDPPAAFHSPLAMEMKRRVWAVVRELELQSSFEFGLPTLLHSMESDVVAPANVDDKDLHDTTSFPVTKPSSQKTLASFQSQSARSWALRLEISRQLFSTGTPKALSYEDVLRYTHELTQALDSLPSWSTDKGGSGERRESCILASTVLRLQLQECILVVHRDYCSSHSLSEMICYHTSREMLLMNRELANLGIQGLALIREDLLVASLSLTRIGLLQPKGSAGYSVDRARSIIELLEECLPLIEQRYLRCYHGEPWGPLTMCGAIMALKIHLGSETRQAAVSNCAQRFLDLYYRHISRKESPLADKDSSQIPGAPCYPDPEHEHAGFPYLDFDPFDLSMDCDMGRPWAF